MKVINKSRKIIGINGGAFAPRSKYRVARRAGNTSCCQVYLEKGILVDAEDTSKNLMVLVT